MVTKSKKPGKDTRPNDQRYYEGFVLITVKKSESLWKFLPNGKMYTLHSDKTFINNQTGKPCKVAPGSKKSCPQVNVHTINRTNLAINQLWNRAFQKLTLDMIEPFHKIDLAVLGYPGYWATTLGKIWSEARYTWIEGHLTKAGWSLTITAIRSRSMKLEKLLAQAFLFNPDPETFKWVGFVDGNTKNVAIHNLAWVNDKSRRMGCRYVRYTCTVGDFANSLRRIGRDNITDLDYRVKVHNNKIRKGDKNALKSVGAIDPERE